MSSPVIPLVGWIQKHRTPGLHDRTLLTRATADLLVLREHDPTSLSRLPQPDMAGHVLGEQVVEHEDRGMHLAAIRAEARFVEPAAA